VNKLFKLTLKIFIIVCFSLVLSLPWVLSANIQDASVVATVNVGGGPFGIAYDSAKSEVFVTNFGGYFAGGGDTVSVISDSTNDVVANITVGANPVGVAYDSAKGELFIAISSSNTVSVISDETYAVVATVTVGSQPYDLVYDGGKGEVFVVNYGSNTVSVISDANNAVVATVNVGSVARGIAYDSAKGEVFVVNYGSNTVSVISDANNAVVATVNVGANPFGIAYDPVMGELFVANSGSNTVSVISDSNNAVVANVTVGNVPNSVAYDSTKGEVFVSNGGQNDVKSLPSSLVSVISDSNNAVVANVTVGSAPFGEVYDPAKSEIFVANFGANTVSVISDSSSLSTTSTPSPTISFTPSPSSLSSQTNLTGTAWVPSIQNGIAAPVVTIVALSAILGIILTITRTSAGSSSSQLGNKTKDLIPDTVKKWLEDFVSSRRKLAVEEKMGSPFLPTKAELLAYVLSIVLLSLSFSYVKVSSLNQILAVLPTILATSILVTFVKTFVIVAYVRSRGVWTEHKIWYFGLATFAVTTFAFRVPFSSPTRRVQSHESSNRLEGILSIAEIGIGLVFAATFFVLLVSGFTLIGSTGLAMCLIGAFFDSFPLTPMNGKTLYEYKKKLWAILFLITLVLYFAWLLLI
jgi:YVTN family beta-propeller protein